VAASVGGDYAILPDVAAMIACGCFSAILRHLDGRRHICVLFLVLQMVLCGATKGYPGVAGMVIVMINILS